MFLVILAAFKSLIQKHGFGNEVRRRGGDITERHVMSLDVRHLFNTAARIGYDDRTVCGLALLLHGGKGLYIALRLGHDVGKRSEIGEVQTIVPHGFNHGRVVGGHHEFHLSAQLFLKIVLQILIIFDHHAGAFIRQKCHAKRLRVSVSGRKGSGLHREHAQKRQNNVADLHNYSSLKMKIHVQASALRSKTENGTTRIR